MRRINHKFKLAFACMAFIALLAGVRHFVFAAADYDFTTNFPAFQTITVTTAAVKNVTIADEDYTLVHLNIQDDGSTASAATDQVIVMTNQDATGNAVTMSANLNDGVKFPLIAGAAGSFVGKFVWKGADGAREIQLKAVGHGAKVLLIRGRRLQQEP